MLSLLDRFGAVRGNEFLGRPARAKVEVAFHRLSPRNVGAVYGRPAAHWRRGSTAPGTDPHPSPVALVFLRHDN
jgi:hypothetical protein